MPSLPSLHLGTNGLFTKKQYDKDKQVLGKKSNMMAKRYPTLLGWSRGLTITKIVQRFNSSYLVLETTTMLNTKAT